ncbi:MAG: DUF4252 domain-containing protein [Bacteroidales bacterium]|nr:DUF4252 domain-containing protein [Bacteroidales bacterium]
MRRAILTIIISLVAFTAFAQDYKTIYQKYSDDERVTAVYISPAMFKMIGKLPEVRIEDNGLDLAPMIKSMTGFYMLQTEDSSLAEKISKDVTRIVGGAKFETLMEIKDKGQKVNILSLGDDQFLKSLLLTVFDSGESMFIGIDGLMNRADVENAVATVSKDLF